MRVITSGFVLLVSFGHLHHASARPHAKYKKLTQPGWVEEVIVQMFEWDWDSIATECTDFLGPAGYGFVQGTPHLILVTIDSSLLFNSKPPTGTCRGPSMVDRLSAGILQHYLETGEP